MKCETYLLWYSSVVFALRVYPIMTLNDPLE